MIEILKVTILHLLNIGQMLIRLLHTGMFIILIMWSIGAMRAVMRCLYLQI